ncbi:MAG: hypothetical protein GKR99_11780 [Rhodobacteraceae bacterium]|nr:hypothetical protein [Paracoccaceae bacterium]
MTKSDLEALAEEIERLPEYDPALTRRAFDLVEIAMPQVDRQLIEADALGTVDAVVLLIDHEFPGWSLRMDGIANERNGHWHCTLRRSTTRDNDAFIGIGKGPKLSNALIGALLKSLARKAKAATSI